MVIIREESDEGIFRSGKGVLREKSFRFLSLSENYRVVFSNRRSLSGSLVF